ncbi:MAG: hypothetical protein ACYSSL_03285 [Planctomycetota bacterium]|jgi:hypothetical protein
MFSTKFSKSLLLCSIIIMGLSVSSCRKEEHPSKEAATGGLTRDELADAIESYVAQEAASHGGYFTVFDETVGKELKLKLDKVHRQRLSRVGEDLYFSCADFKTDGGKIYDLDVFMQGSEKADLTFTEFMIHKEACRERYTWYEEGGIWKRKPVGTTGEKKAEHPKEHPSEHPSEHPE